MNQAARTHVAKISDYRDTRKLYIDVTDNRWRGELFKDANTAYMFVGVRGVC